MDIINVTDPDAPSRLGLVELPMLAYMGTLDESALIAPADALGILQQKATSRDCFETVVMDGADHCFTQHGTAAGQLIADWILADR